MSSLATTGTVGSPARCGCDGAAEGGPFGALTIDSAPASTGASAVGDATTALQGAIGQ